jgi:hypothetical protein
LRNYAPEIGEFISDEAIQFVLPEFSFYEENPPDYSDYSFDYPDYSFDYPDYSLDYPYKVSGFNYRWTEKFNTTKFKKSYFEFGDKITDENRLAAIDYIEKM